MLRNQVSAGAHISEETLELYALGHAGDDQNAVIEEHLLVCEPCQDTMFEVSDYVMAMKQACLNVVEARERKPVRRWYDALFVPKLAWAAGLAVAFVGILLPVLRSPQQILTGPESELTLSATRGAESLNAVIAPANKPLRLNIGLQGIPVHPAYVVEIVSSSGVSEGRLTVAPAEQTLAVHWNQRLQPGAYWVRVSSPEGHPLRELGMQVR